MLQALTRSLSIGTLGLTSGSADRVKILNLVAYSSALVALFYSSYYYIFIKSTDLALLNSTFVVAYFLPVLFNFLGHHLTAKIVMFLLVIIQIVCLCTFIFTLETGFQLYLLLVFPGVFLVFEYDDALPKILLSVAAALAIVYCEIFGFSKPLFDLTSEQNRFLFRTTLLVMVFELLLVNYLFTRNVKRRETEFKIQANTDPLTGMYNRRFFNLALKKQIEFSNRYGRPFSLILIDFDFFKKINDEFGHQFGDKLLIESTRLLGQYCRFNDLISRVGGEEFMIILPESELEPAKQTSYKLRETFEQYPFFTKDGKEIQITISIGIVQWQPKETSEEIIERVDKALYSAKENGRNRVEIG